MGSNNIVEVNEIDFESKVLEESSKKLVLPQPCHSKDKKGKMVKDSD